MSAAAETRAICDAKLPEPGQAQEAEKEEAEKEEASTGSDSSKGVGNKAKLSGLAARETRRRSFFFISF